MDKLTIGNTGASVVGRDLGFRLNGGPEGNYFKHSNGNLATENFQLQEKLDETLLLWTSATWWKTQLPPRVCHESLDKPHHHFPTPITTYTVYTIDSI